MSLENGTLTITPDFQENTFSTVFDHCLAIVHGFLVLAVQSAVLRALMLHVKY